MIPVLIGGLVWLAVVGGLAWRYLLPSLIAFRRRHRHRWIILIVDFVFWGERRRLALGVFLGLACLARAGSFGRQRFSP